MREREVVLASRTPVCREHRAERKEPLWATDLQNNHSLRGNYLALGNSRKIYSYWEKNFSGLSRSAARF